MQKSYRSKYLATKDPMVDPRRFFHQLIDCPGEEVTPSDVGMNSSSPANLLKRVKVTKDLKELFFERGSRKNSIKLKQHRVLLREMDVSTQLKIRQQLESLNLKVYEECQF